MHIFVEEDVTTVIETLRAHQILVGPQGIIERSGGKIQAVRKAIEIGEIDTAPSTGSLAVVIISDDSRMHDYTALVVHEHLTVTHSPADVDDLAHLPSEPPFCTIQDVLASSMSLHMCTQLFGATEAFMCEYASRFGAIGTALLKEFSIPDDQAEQWFESIDKTTALPPETNAKYREFLSWMLEELP